MGFSPFDDVIGATRRRRRWQAFACSITALALAAPTTGTSAAGTGDTAALKELAGRWSGWGAVTLASGQSEQVKCIATYFVRDEGGGLEQNLRCASQSYRIDAKAEMTIEGEVVKGRWEERANAAAGDISGLMKGTSFNLSIHGDNFTASMAVSSSACKQSISISPQGFDISRIAIGLQKC